MTDMRSVDQTIDKGRRLLLALLVALPAAAPAAAPLFARFTADRPAPYAGEAFQLTLRIHITGGNLDKQISISGMPDASELQIRGFEELPIESVSLDGVSYEVRPFRTWARATRAGVLSLNPRLDCTWLQVSRSFFFMQESRRPAADVAEPFRIEVRPLPPPPPATSCSGLVGAYRFAASAAPLDVAPGDLITLTMSVEGDWIPDTFRLPILESSPAFKVYEMKPDPESPSPNRWTGRQTIVPQGSANTVIPALTLTLFDPATGTYKPLTAGPFPVTFHAEKVINQPVYSPPKRGTGDVRAITGPTDTREAPPPDSRVYRLVKALTGRRDVIIVGRSDVTVRYAPMESSQALFTLKPGTRAGVDSEHEEWLRVATPQGTGWVPREQTGDVK